MAHRANINFYFYSRFGPGVGDDFEAYNWFKTQADLAGKEVILMHYPEEPIALESATNVATWFSDDPNPPPLNYPFVIYEEAYDYMDTPPRIHRKIEGKQNIMSQVTIDTLNFQS